MNNILSNLSYLDYFSLTGKTNKVKTFNLTLKVLRGVLTFFFNVSTCLNSLKRDFFGKPNNGKPNIGLKTSLEEWKKKKKKEGKSRNLNSPKLFGKLKRQFCCSTHVKFAATHNLVVEGQDQRETGPCST